MVKKIIIGVVLLLLVIGGYFLGKNIYYNKIYNYTKVVNEGMETYYKSNDTTDIDSIKTLVPLYEGNDEILEDIRDKVYAIFEEWYDYTNNKYVCNLDSVNQCILYAKELEDLAQRLPKLKFAWIINEDKSKVLSKEINNKIKEVNAIINDPKATRGETHEEHRKVLCSKMEDDDCELQRDGTSICVYSIGTIKETVVCKRASSENK